MKKLAFKRRQSLILTALGLLLGLIAIVIYSSTLMESYSRASMTRLTKPQLARNLESITSVVKTLPIKQFQAIHRDIIYPGMRVRIKKNNHYQHHIVTNLTETTLQKVIRDADDYFKMSYQLPNGKWLCVSAPLFNVQWLLKTFGLQLFLLGFLIIIYCYLFLWRFVWPITHFVTAAERFSKDVDAPPMALQGPVVVKMAISAFNQMQIKLKQHLSSHTQTLAAISHDLRTPLTRLKLRVEQFADHTSITNINYAKVNRDIETMEGMITSILNFAKQDYQKESLQRFDLNSLLQTICDDFSDVGKAVTYQGPNAPIPFSGRIKAISRALNNFIDNALKYGGVADVYLDESKTEAIIRIQDAGPGIPENEMEKVFLPFYRVNAARSVDVPGSGLGLAVAKEIIEYHDGQILLLNRQPQGLLVKITLPFRG